MKIELPSGWLYATIEEIASTGTGGTPSRKNDSYYGGDIPWVKSGDLNDGLVSVVDELITLAGLENSNAKLFPKGTVCIALYGATVGKLGILELEASTNQAICGIFPESGVNPLYVFYGLRNIRSRLISQAQGGAQPNINNGIIKQTTLPIPPEQEQTRIVTAIESLQQRSARARVLLTEVSPLLVNLRQSILQAAFSGRLTADWRANNPDVEPADQLLARIRTERRQRWETGQLEKYDAKGKKPPNNWMEKYKEPEPVSESEVSSLPTIPDTWCWARYEEVAWEITVGHVGPMKHQYVENGITMFRSQNVRPLNFEVENSEFIPPDFDEEIKKSRLYGDEVLVVRSGVNVGDCCVFPEAFAPANCSDLVITRLLNAINPHFAAMYINSPTGKAALRLKRVGNAQPHFNVGSMKHSVFPLAPLQEQELIAALVYGAKEAELNLATRVRASESMLSELDQSILSKAFRGELVPQDPNDEPASELLARIRAIREKEQAEKKAFKKKSSKKKAKRKSTDNHKL